MANDRTQSAQVKKNSRAEEWLKNAVKDKHVRMIPFSEISKVKYNVAKGGSGTIHLGAWRNMHIAIKEQHNTNDLIKELKMHKQVHDSNYIVKFFGITKHPLTHDTCIVMQFAENGCLQDYLETQNVSITWLTKYRLAWEIASGLDFIHRENIFHTDLHSRNILIDTGGKALITDFGLSKSVNKTIYTTKAGLFGVVPYVAPERMQNPTYTYNAKCDIYSLGVIFWELSSCVIPFEVQLQDVMLAVNIIAGVREKTVPGTAVEYEMLFRRCWDGLPQNRPNMDIVLSELVELLAAEQINPRPAAPRPISPRPPRPLSSESMIAPSTPFPYDNNDNIPSPESTNHMRPASPPSRPNVRQSFAQLGPLAQNIPSVPIRQPDRAGAGARVSFVGDQLPKDTKPDQGKNVRQNAHLVPDSPTFNNNVHINNPPPKPTGTTPTDKKASPRASPTPEPGNKASSSSPTPEDKKTPSTPQLLPPLPTFGALALTTPPKDISLVPPINQNLSVLPETASLALASGLSMVNVVNKLNLTNIKNISTISPPPPGAPPPPPGTAGTAGTPRVISPPSNRPKVISPSKTRNNATPPRASKTISPPAPGRVLPPPGAPPKAAPSPSLGPTPKPPTGPPPSPHLNGSPSSGNSKAPHMTYVPVTTYTPAPKSKGQEKKEGKDEESSETRPTPVRQLPLGFPVVPTLDPHVFGKRTPAEPTHLPSPASSPSSATASAPPSSGSTPSSVRNSTLLDIQSLKGDIFRANSPDMSRRDDAKNSRAIDMVKPPSPQYDNNQNRILNNSPSLTPSPSNRGAQGFFPVVDGRSGAKDPKLTALGNRSQDSLYKIEESNTSKGEDKDNKSKDASAKAPVAFNNFYSLADPYKDLNMDEPSDFFTAVTQGDMETIERILKAYPYLIHDSNGFWPHPTPIMVAARSRNAIDTMKVLLRHGAALDRGDQNGMTVLHFVCEQYPNPTEALTFLTKAGADCNSRDCKKRTPLMALLQNTHLTSNKALIESMRILFKFGASTKAADQQYNRTPLHYAILHCKEPAPVIELLLKKSADVNACDWRKNTPLHMVLERVDNEEIVQMLLLYGADPSLKNGNKRNALCVAAENLRVMSAWFLLENDLMSSAPETIKKANELCSKADGPDKNSKPLFKNLLSDWQGKEGKIRRIQLAQDCILRVQRTADMKTIDQTQVALEFLEKEGAPLYHPEPDNGAANGAYIPATQGGGGLGAGGAPGLLRLNGLRKNNNTNNNNNSSSNNTTTNNTHNNNNSLNGDANNISHNNRMNGAHVTNGSTAHANGIGSVYAPMSGGHVQVKELRLAEGVEPLKQTMLPVKSVHQLEKEREAIRYQLEFASMSNAF